MNRDSETTDEQAIKELIGRQFSSLAWTPETSANWDSFTADFLQGASLYPSARPVRRQTPDAFVERLAGLARTTLRSFRENALGTEVRVFGNVAVAAAGCETIENENEVNRGVEMLLLVKEDGRWRIVAQAWDSESPELKLPSDLQA